MDNEIILGILVFCVFLTVVALIAFADVHSREIEKDKAICKSQGGEPYEEMNTFGKSYVECILDKQDEAGVGK